MLDAVAQEEQAVKRDKRTTMLSSLRIILLPSLRHNHGEHKDGDGTDCEDSNYENDCHERDDELGGVHRDDLACLGSKRRHRLNCESVVSDYK